MAKHQYKGITFAKGWNGTLEQFKAEFEGVHVFQGIPQKERLAEMKKVFNQITKSEAKEK
jgi:hypothetical protein